MAKKQEEKDEKDVIQNFLGSLLNGYKDDHYNFVETKPVDITTGSLLLDSYVKLTSGSVVRLCGPLESGKTSQALLLVQNYLSAIKNSRGLYVKAEGRLGENMKERSGLKFVYHQDDWKIGTVFVLESNVFETVSDVLQGMLKTMHEHDEKLVFIIDSLDGLILKADLEKSAGQNHQPAGVPKMTKMLFRKLALPINKYGALAILISQYSETFKIDPYAKDKPQPVQGVGGSAVSHQPDWILEYGVRYNSHNILEDQDEKPDPIKNKIIGHTVNITLRKSTNETTGTKIVVPIRYGQKGNSVWKSREVVDLVLAWELIKKDKNTYSFDPNIIKEASAQGVDLDKEFVGKKRMLAFFDENENVIDFFYKKIKTII